MLGFEKEFCLDVKRESLSTLFDNNSVVLLNIELLGLKGGHTGIEIHLGRANALKIIARLLSHLILTNTFQVYLYSAHGGNAINAIPSTANVSIHYYIVLCSVLFVDGNFCIKKGITKN